MTKRMGGIQVLRIRVISTTFEELLGPAFKFLCRTSPSNFVEFPLLGITESQTGTGHSKLYQEQQEQNDHIKKEEDLVMLNGSNQANDSNQEEEDTTGDDASHHMDRRYDSHRLSICSHSNQHKGYHYVHDIQQRQHIPRARKSATSHCLQTIEFLKLT